MFKKILRKLFSYDDPASKVNQFRASRHRRLLYLLASTGAKEPLRVIDLGGALRYWEKQGLPENAHLTVLNLGHPTPDELKRAAALGPDVDLVQGDATDVPYGDNSFDVVFSNSVIEHVGSRPAQKKFADEARRLAPRLFIQTPSQWFLLEPHTRIPLFSYFPRPLRALVIWKARPRYYPRVASWREAVEATNTTILLRRSDMRTLFPQAKLETERFLGLPKSYTACQGFTEVP